MPIEDRAMEGQALLCGVRKNSFIPHLLLRMLQEHHVFTHGIEHMKRNLTYAQDFE